MRDLGRIAAGVRRRFARSSTAITQTAQFWLRHHDRDLLEKFDRGFAEDAHLDPADEKKDQEVIERITNAYRLAKAAQLNAPPQFAVGPMWEGMVRRNFGDVIDAMDEDGSNNHLAELLSSFHRNSCGLWAGGSYEDFVAARRSALYRFQFINTWLRYRKVYWESAGEALGLSYSQVGRPVGMADDDGVVPLESIRYHHWARRMTELVGQSEHPVICEIGGGLGGQAYKVASTPGWAGTYLIFDIPETLLIASYFLLRSLPERRFLLFGEGSLNSHEARDYNLVLLPNFEFPILPEASVDLVFNSCSFSEMLEETALAYIREAERACSGLILHINHTAQLQWEINGQFAPIVRQINWYLTLSFSGWLKRYPRPFGRVEDRAWLRQHRARHDVYLYRRRDAA